MTPNSLENHGGVDGGLHACGGHAAGGRGCGGGDGGGNLVSKWFRASYSLVLVIQTTLLTSHLGLGLKLLSHTRRYCGYVWTCSEIDHGIARSAEFGI